MDLMIRWADPMLGEVPMPPPETENEGFYRAGFRCLKLLRGAPTTSEVPVIVYTVIGRQEVGVALNDASHNVLFLQKHADLRDLILMIRSLVVDLPQERRPTWFQTLIESIEAKPGWLGFSVDLKRLRSKRGHGS